MGPLSEVAKTCKVCGSICTQQCSACNKISYCSKEHQKEDWKSHKSECFPATISQNDIVGRFLVATKNIKQGELILKEKPLITGPNCGGLLGISNTNCCFPLCLSCYRVVKTNYYCSSCKWPVCGLQCQMMRNHAANECQVFTERKVPSFQINEAYMYEKIIILRGLLCKELNPDIWKKIQSLESHSQERKETIKGSLLSKSAIEFIQVTCGLIQFSCDEIDHVVGVLGTNAFWNNDNNMASETIFRSGSYLYYYGSIPEHNCTPNSSWTIQMNSEFQLRASVDIPAGESITQLYTEATLGTLERRKHLKDTKYFDCSCKRCSDPTEFNTHFSTLKCNNCTNGYLLSITPLNNDSPQWKCQNIISTSSSLQASSFSSCAKVESTENIEKIIVNIQQEKAIANSEDPNSTASMDQSFKCIESLHQVLINSQSKCHKNHYLIYELENIIIQRISYIFAIPSNINNKRKLPQLTKFAKLMIELCKKCLNLTVIILPGFSTQRGRLLYFLQQGLTMDLYLNLKSTSNNNKQQQQLLNNNSASAAGAALLEEIDQCRKEGQLILKYEPEGREEFLIHKFLQEPSEYLKFVQNFYNKK